jgi:hemoglobin-like flavoprotein
MSASELYESNNHTQHLYKQAFGEYSKILNLFNGESEGF